MEAKLEASRQWAGKEGGEEAEEFLQHLLDDFLQVCMLWTCRIL